MRKIKFICLICSLLVFAGCAVTFHKNVNSAVDLKILTEEYAPLNFMENGKITGQVTEVVRELLKRTGTDNCIQMGTWQEVYKAVLTKPNVALFSMAMTSERKDLLQWVGPVASLDTSLYARKGSGIKIETLEEAKKVKESPQSRSIVRSRR